MQIYNIPIEPIEERYSVQWDEWFNSFFNNQDAELQTIYGEKTSGKINTGAFLDVIETNIYKTSQLLTLTHLLADYKDDFPLVLFLHDLWFPGIETIAYIRDGMGFKNLKICGCLHAGSYDKNDFLYHKNMHLWADKIEESWFANIADMIFVATDYHKRLLIQQRNVPTEKIKVTGFPIYDTFSVPCIKERSVVFPHRTDKEKRPDLFKKLANEIQPIFPAWNFIYTKEEAKNKKEYYQILNKAAISVSFAEQETWGIAMQESVICNALPVVPDCLSYSEMYFDEFKATSYKGIKRKVLQFMSAYETDKDIDLSVQRNKILLKGAAAMQNIFNEIKQVI
jgi:glycosyltransferase involved in cell wall biosynthesis